MTTADLIACLNDHDVHLATDGDRLIIDGPDHGILNDRDLLDHLSDRKAELLAILRGDYPAALVALVDRDAPDQADDLIDTFHERAAIYEFDAHLRRSVAEEIAFTEIANQIANTGPDAPTRVIHRVASEGIACWQSAPEK